MERQTLSGTPSGKTLRLELHGHVYLNPVKEEATLRDRLGHHEFTVARSVAREFVAKYRPQLRADEASLLNMWGDGYGLRTLAEVFDGAKLFHMHA
jgi:hypothetical protein